ncbi:MAG: hypothetical protein U1E29_04970 [Coriobacteriia bacterium]|nr:hypothetical protein [Coriobacteriia bacterium]
MTFIWWVYLDGDPTGPYENETDATEAARAIQKDCPEVAIEVVREPDYRLGLNRGEKR